MLSCSAPETLGLTSSPLSVPDMSLELQEVEVESLCVGLWRPTFVWMELWELLLELAKLCGSEGSSCSWDSLEDELVSSSAAAARVRYLWRREIAKRAGEILLQEPKDH